MIEVCLIYDIDNVGHDILVQTPNRSGVFNNCKFTLYNQNNIDSLPAEVDALIILNSPIDNVSIKVPPQLTYLISQEAPNDRYKWHTDSFKYFSEVHTQWPIKKKNVIPSHGFLTWYIEKSFDELKNIDLNKNKNSSVAYIGNKEAILSGQVKRNNFVEVLNKSFQDNDTISVDLIGRTYNNPIDNKFDALYGYQYGLAIENTIVDHYWTEKISDLFLAGCLPFYIGPPNILEYFPEESIIMLDFDDIDRSLEIIKSTIENNEFEKRKKYIEEARNKVLTDYNLFYNFSNIINTKSKEIADQKKEIFIPKNYWNKQQSFLQKLKNKLS